MKLYTNLKETIVYILFESGANYTYRSSDTVNWKTVSVFPNNLARLSESLFMRKKGWVSKISYKLPIEYAGDICTWLDDTFGFWSTSETFRLVIDRVPISGTYRISRSGEHYLICSAIVKRTILEQILDILVDEYFRVQSI